MKITDLKFRKDTPDGDKMATLRFAEALADNKQPVATNYSAFGARKVDETSSGPVVEAIAVSEGIKRDGSTIQVKGIDLRNLKANPVLMWAHRYDQPPIGRIVDFRKTNVEGLGKVLKIRFTPLKTTTDTEHKRFADSIFEMLVNGDLRTVSFGWRTLEAEPIRDGDGYYTGWNFIRTDAMETSVVPVPADPDALITNIRERGLNPERFVATKNERGIYEVRETLPDEFKAGEWRIVESDDDETVDADPENEQRAPVEVGVVLAAEGSKDETVMDLEKLMKEFGARFESLEKRIDEIPVGENRKGAVLNSANRKALTDAMQLIAAVLRNAGPQEADGDADTGKSAAEPEGKRESETPKEPEFKFEDIEDIRSAMNARKEEIRQRSLAADILGELVTKTKARSKNG